RGRGRQQQEEGVRQPGALWTPVDPMTDPAKQSRDEKDSDQRTWNARQSSETRIDPEILPGVAERMASDIDAGRSIHRRDQLDIFVDLRQVGQAKDADDEAVNGKANKTTRPAEDCQ